MFSDCAISLWGVTLMDAMYFSTLSWVEDEAEIMARGTRWSRAMVKLVTYYGNRHYGSHSTLNFFTLLYLSFAELIYHEQQQFIDELHSILTWWSRVGR